MGECRKLVGGGGDGERPTGLVEEDRVVWERRGEEMGREGKEKEEK